MNGPRRNGGGEGIEPVKRRGSIFLVILGLLLVMLLLGLALSKRFSGQARQAVVADQSSVARYFLESYAADVLWQIRKQKNKEGGGPFKAFRSGTGVTRLDIDYAPSSPIKKLADQLDITMGPEKPAVVLDEVKFMPYAPEAFRQDKANEEKKGILGITCRIKYEKRAFSLEVRYPFKVVLQTTPVLRKFVAFFDQLHLEQQPEPFGSSDRINVIPIGSNLAQGGFSPFTLSGNDPQDREKNGYVFLGSDEKKIFLNMVGGAFKEDDTRPSLEDLGQIAPSAFDVTAGQKEFGEETLFNDTTGNPVIVRGAGIPLKYQGHYSRFGLLGFSEEISGSALLGDFRLDRFLNGDPSFAALQGGSGSLKQSSALRLRGNLRFVLFEREIFGNAFARFFLLSFFEAPSVGSPVSFSSDPNKKLNFAQYGNAQNISFEPVNGTYCDYMSRVVSGGKPIESLGEKASVPVYRDQSLKHKILKASDFKECDGLRPAGGFSAIGGAWFPDGPYTGPGGRPNSGEKSVLGRITRYFKTARDFKKAVGLEGSPKKRCWIDGVVYVHERLSLPEGITTDDIRGGVVLVKGDISIGNIDRGDSSASRKFVSPAIPLDKMLTFVSLPGARITLTGNTYLGVQFFSFKPRLSGTLEQLGFSQGTKFTFFGGLGCSTPQLERITRQFPPNQGLYPLINYAHTLACPQASYTVDITDRIQEYEFNAD